MFQTVSEVMDEKCMREEELKRLRETLTFCFAELERLSAKGAGLSEFDQIVSRFPETLKPEVRSLVHYFERKIADARERELVLKAERENLRAQIVELAKAKSVTKVGDGYFYEN